MQFTITKDEFLRGLSRTQSVIEKKTTLPILSNVLIEAAGAAVTLVATDLEVGVRGMCEAEVGKEGSITVQAKKLYEICRELDSDVISFKAMPNDWVEISGGNFSSKIVGLSAEDYPVLPSTEGAMEFTINGQILAEMIDKTQFAISTNETRYYLNGVFFVTVNGNLRMVATDGHRMALCEKELPAGIDATIDPGIIIPKKGVMELRKLLAEGEGDVVFGVKERNIFVRQGGTELIVRLIDGDYPDYEQVVPKKNDKIVTISRDKLFSALRRVSIMATELDKGVKVSLGRGSLEISCKNPNLGEAVEQVQANYEGAEMEIGFNARYILDSLGVLNDEDVILEMADGLSPCTIKTPSDQGYLSVVMPMRLE